LLPEHQNFIFNFNL